MKDRIVKFVCAVMWLITGFIALNVVYDAGHPKPVVIPCTTDTECMELNPNLGDY